MRRTRQGFTLIELMVVMVILAVLAGLLLAAVSAVRESGRTTSCSNNMRNVALAIINFEDINKRLPGLWECQTCNPEKREHQYEYFVSVPDPNSTTGGTMQQARKGSYSPSWVFPILAQLDRPDLAKKHAVGGVWFTRQPFHHLEVMVCPSDTRARGFSTSMSYVASAGLATGNSTSEPRDGSANPQNLDGTMSPYSWVEDLATSVFHDFRERFTPEGVSQSAGSTNRTNNLKQQTMGYISAGDGVTDTLLLSENLDATFWVREGYDGDVGFCWFNTLTPHPWMRINGRAGEKERYFPRPSSNHGGGVNVAYCDGHTDWMSEQIDWITYNLLMTPRGRDATQADPSKGPVLDTFRMSVMDSSLK